MKEKKIYGVIIIIICALSVSAGTKIKESEKMEYIWKYNEIIDNSTADGSVGIRITPTYQQTLKITLIVIRSIAGDNAGGTSGTYIIYNLDGTTTQLSLIYDQPDGTVVLPNDDYSTSVKKPNIEDLIFIDGDSLSIFRTNMDDANGSIEVAVRAISNIYARPTLAYHDTNNVRDTLYFNDICAVI